MDGRATRGSSTRALIIDAAVAQLAAEGMRGLTHRRVEVRAGVAQGSVKHHFGSLDGLVTAVLEHLVAADLPLVITPGPADGPEEVLAAAKQVLESVWSRPELVRARFALYLHAAGDPALQELVTSARDRFVERFAAALPGPHADAAARFVAAFMDGLLLDQVSAPDQRLADAAPGLMVAAALAAREIAAGSFGEIQK